MTVAEAPAKPFFLWTTPNYKQHLDCMTGKHKVIESEGGSTFSYSNGAQKKAKEKKQTKKRALRKHGQNRACTCIKQVDKFCDALRGMKWCGLDERICIVETPLQEKKKQLCEYMSIYTDVWNSLCEIKQTSTKIYIKCEQFVLQSFDRAAKKTGNKA